MLKFEKKSVAKRLIYTSFRGTEWRHSQALGMINQELLDKVEANFPERLQIFILQNGRHLSDIIFRT